MFWREQLYTDTFSVVKGFETDDLSTDRKYYRKKNTMLDCSNLEIHSGKCDETNEKVHAKFNFYLTETLERDEFTALGA